MSKFPLEQDDGQVPVVAADIDRIRRILTAPAAAGLEKMAIHLAIMTDLPAELAIEALDISRFSAGLPPVFTTDGTVH